MTWVKGKGGVKIWTGPKPVDADDDDKPPVYTPAPGDLIGPDGRTLKGRCTDCGRPIRYEAKRCKPCYNWSRGVGKGHRRMSPDSAIQDVLERMSRQLREQKAATHSPGKSRPVCPDCDCLLTREGERCPACLVWAEKTAVAASWLVA